jgi:hypothetical protein
MAIDQSSSTPFSPQDKHRNLAMKLADACSNPSYSPDLWAAYFKTFQEVLANECGDKAVQA